MRHVSAVVLLSLAAAAIASAEGRNPAIRVFVRIAQGAADGRAESKLDVEETLQRQKPDSVLAYAAAEPADLVLRIARRYTTRKRPGGDALASETAGLLCVVAGLVIDDERRYHDLYGASVIWREAAVKLVDALAEYAEERQHELLRKRPDWPDLGFEFEPLTKERRKQFGAKDGAIIVTTVRPTGLAEKAGLQVGEVILSLADKKLKTPADLARSIYVSAGAELRLELAQRGARRTVTLAVP